MRYFLLAFSALLLHCGEGFAKNVKIRWHGQSFFEVESSSGTILAIDPHNLEAYGRRQVKADAVLITHFHIDHASPEPIVDFKATKKIYGLKSRRGLESTRETDEFYDLDEKVKDFHITNMNCYHDDMEGLRRGKNAAMIMEVDGLRIVHLGDLGHKLTKAQIRKLGQVDVLLIPVGGVYTLNGTEAKEVIAQIKPRRYVIPMHYATKVYGDLLSLDEFLEEQNEKMITRTKFNELIVDADAVPEKQPRIAILNYEQEEKKEKEKEKEKDK